MLGLFLGASVFTIIDFIRYAINYTYKEYKIRFRDEESSGSKQRRRRSKDKNNNFLNGNRGGKKGGTHVPAIGRKRLKKTKLSPSAERSKIHKSSSESGGINGPGDAIDQDGMSAFDMNGQNNVLKLI